MVNALPAFEIFAHISLSIFFTKIFSHLSVGLIVFCLLATCIVSLHGSPACRLPEDNQHICCRGGKNAEAQSQG